MGADQQIDWREAAASVLDWWQAAGVDTLVDDAPRDWFAASQRIAEAVPAAVPMPVPAVADRAAMPATITEFLAWRGGPDAPEAAWRGATIAASGPADATVMVLLDCPDRDDEGDGTLLAGQAGRLFDRMLAAIGLDRTRVHLAAVCARRPAAGRIAGEVEARLAAIAQHHVALVAPRRLLLLGNAASRAILGADVIASRGHLHPIGHKIVSDEADSVAVASFHPRFLIEKPAAKAEAWKDLQLLMRGLSA